MRFVKLIAVAKAHVVSDYLDPCPVYPQYNQHVPCPRQGGGGLSLSALHVFNYWQFSTYHRFGSAPALAYTFNMQPALPPSLSTLSATSLSCLQCLLTLSAGSASSSCSCSLSTRLSLQQLVHPFQVLRLAKMSWKIHARNGPQRRCLTGKTNTDRAWW